MRTSFVRIAKGRNELSKGAFLALAQEAWQAVSKSDVAALEKIWSPDLVWHATGRGTPWAGHHAGQEAVLDYLARVGESVDRFDARLDDILLGESRIGYLFHVLAERDDRVLDMQYLLLARIENQIVVEVWTTPLDPASLEAFWA